jgi:hypothetical protein
MSRTNPNQIGSPNPCTRWHEWDGSNGLVRYYDKERANTDGTKGATVNLKLPFTFIMLDELATVKGWHDASDSGITSNEVRDTRTDVMVVRAHKGGVIATGLYADIRDRVSVAGGNFTANIYIAYRDGEQLRLGSIQFKGVALKNWMEFKKTNAKALWEQAVQIVSYKDGKKGNISFRSPTFALRECSQATNDAAGELQKVIAEYLKEYFARTKSVQAAHAPQHQPQASAPAHPPMDDPNYDHALTDEPPTGDEPPPSDDVPF